MACKNKNGLTLLEVLLAVFVLAIVAVPLLNMFVTNTQLVRNAGEINKSSYTAQSVLEDVQRLGYSELYSYAPLPGVKANYQIRSVTDSSVVVSKPVTIDRIPYGGFNNLVGGTACYAHLILSGSSATFTGPDGIMRAGLSYGSGITLSSTTMKVGSSVFDLNKPAGANLILIIHAGSSAIPAVSISVPASVPYVLYALNEEDPVTQSITVVGGSGTSKSFRKFNSKTDSSKDPLPDYLLVNVVCKVYGDNGSVINSAQNTIQVKLP